MELITTHLIRIPGQAEKALMAFPLRFPHLLPPLVGLGVISGPLQCALGILVLKRGQRATVGVAAGN